LKTRNGEIFHGNNKKKNPCDENQKWHYGPHRILKTNDGEILYGKKMKGYEKV
jgi:hypothetical protein